MPKNQNELKFVFVSRDSGKSILPLLQKMIAEKIIAAHSSRKP